MTTNFGRDVSCTTSMRTGRFSTGVRAVAEAAFRRLRTPRGMLHGDEDEKNYGLDPLGLVGSVRTKADEAALPGRISAELTKDERIETVTVRVLSTKVGPATHWKIYIDAETAEGPFSLQVGVDGVTVELLNIKAEG